MPASPPDYLPKIIQPGNNPQRNRLAMKLFGHEPLKYYVGNITLLAAVFDAKKKKFPCIPI
jgi:2,3-bisphosphoglycerate-independent phosphoglycerate mutase